MNQGERILRVLSRIGYPKADEFEGDTLDWLFDCEPLIPFLEWLCENVHESNVLSVEDLKRYVTKTKFFTLPFLIGKFTWCGLMIILPSAQFGILISLVMVCVHMI